MIQIGDKLILTEDFIEQQWNDKGRCSWEAGDEVIVDSYLDANTIGFKQFLDRDKRTFKIGSMSVEMALTQVMVV